MTVAPGSEVLTHVTPAAWLRALPLVPLAGAAVNGLAGAPLQARLGRRAVHAIAIAAMVFASLLALAGLERLSALAPPERYLLDDIAPLLHVGQLHTGLALALDPLSAVMALVITLVGTLIHIYATAYMHEEPSAWRFFACLNLFVAAMLLLVLGDSLVTLFFGWEGVGLASYLLIGFWYREPKNATAALKAFVVNRVGDAGLLAGVALLFWSLGGAWSTVDRAYYPDAAARVQLVERAGVRPVELALGPTVSLRELRDELAFATPDGRHPIAERLSERQVWGVPAAILIALLMFMGAAGKSAQIPLYVWLPDAMAGPTPVSALIHAATMVTAGVYLIARLSFVFALAPGALSVIALVGAVTALWAASIAVAQRDLKKVLAYSTVSQLGFMFVGVGVGAFSAGVFHLVTHACFKACLFLGAGSVIHGMHRLVHARAEKGGALDDAQDLRHMGGLGALMPRTRRAYFIACCAIAGFPFAAGFFSKDEILSRAFGVSTVVWAIAMLAALLTAFYMFRSYYLVFEGRPATEEQRLWVVESPRVMTAVLAALAVASLVVGPLLGFPSVISHAVPLLARWLEPVMALPAGEAHASTELALAIASIAVAVIGWAAARALYRDLERSRARRAALRALARLHALLGEGYRVDELYALLFVRPFGRVAAALAWCDAHVVDGAVHAVGALSRGAAWLGGAMDRYLVDGAVNGFAALVVGSGQRLRRLQTGRVNNYVLGVVLGVVVLVVITWL